MPLAADLHALALGEAMGEGPGFLTGFLDYEKDLMVDTVWQSRPLAARLFHCEGRSSAEGVGRIHFGDHVFCTVHLSTNRSDVAFQSTADLKGTRLYYERDKWTGTARYRQKRFVDMKPLAHQ